MIVALVTLAHLAGADERVVAVFPRSNRVVIEERANGSVRLGVCALPADRSAPPAACVPLGVPTPDGEVSDDAFNRALDEEIARLTRARRRAGGRFLMLESAVVASVAVSLGLEAWSVRRRLGRAVTRAELSAVLRTSGPFALFAAGLFATGDVLVQTRSTIQHRALRAFRRPRPDDANDGLVVFNDALGAYEAVVRALDGATRRASGNPAPR